jgi:hypothetical protein
VLGITRRRFVGVSSALTMALVLGLMLTTMASATGPVVHRVSAGGPDVCVAFGDRPGCDGNYSLVATQYADGSVSGQYTDRFARGDGFHAVIDCLVVVGNDAWVSGVITQGRFTDPDTGEVFDLTGLFVSTRIQDNGTSGHPDQISFSDIEFDPLPCTDQLDFPLFDTRGQVVVR